MYASAGLSGTRAIWTLFSTDAAEELHHIYQVISREDSTRVLSNLQEIEEGLEFYTAGPTLNVGNIYNNSRIVQIYKNWNAAS